VLTVQDCFTKWSEAYPLTKKKTALVVDALNTQWISRFGMPKTILSDNGMEFAGKIYKGMMKQLGIQILNSSPYYPRANGMVERLNATLQDMLKTAIIETGNGWVDLLPYITATYRTTVQETTGYTPNKLVLGKEIPLPIDAIMRAEQHEGRCPTEYVNWVENTLYAVKQIAAATIRKQQERQKKHHDKTLKNRDVQEQDVVLRWRPSRKKLQSKWIGPYKVIRRHDRQLVLEDAEGKFKCANISQVKKYLQGQIDADRQFLQRPVLTDSDSEEEIETRPLQQMGFEPVRGEPEEHFYFPDKPDLEIGEGDPLILPVEDLEVPELDDDSADETDSDLDISTDGQVGRGINHDERREIAEYVTRYGRITQTPTRWVASKIEIPIAQENVTYCLQKGNREQRPVIRREENLESYTRLRTHPETQQGRNVTISKKREEGKKSEREEKNPCIENNREKTIRAIVEKVIERDCNQAGLLVKDPGKPIYASSPSKRTVEEKSEQKPTESNNKRVKWFSGRVYAIYAKKQCERKNIAIRSKKERERTLLGKNNAGKARDCDVVIKETRDDKLKTFIDHWREVKKAVKLGDLNAIPVAKELIKAYKTCEGDDSVWKRLIDRITKAKSTGNSEKRINNVTGFNEPELNSKMADRQHVVDAVSVNEEGSNSDISDEASISLEEREKLWTDKQLRSVVEDVLVIAQWNTQTADKPSKGLTNQELEAWKAKLVERQSREKSEDLVDSETEQIAQEHSPRARDRAGSAMRYRNNEDTQLQARLGVYKGSSKNAGKGTKATRKRERSPSREMGEVTPSVSTSSETNINTSIRPANMWYRDLDHMYGKTVTNTLRAHILRRPDGETTYYRWMTPHKDTYDRTEKYEVPRMNPRGKCPFGCDTKGGESAMLQHVRKYHPPLRFVMEGPPPMCDKKKAMESTQMTKHLHQHIDVTEYNMI
jgi:transposase InsO family protein